MPLLTFIKNGNNNIKRFSDMGTQRTAAAYGRAIISIWQRQEAFSTETFGSDFEVGPSEPMDRLRDQIDKIEAMPHGESDYAECFLQLIDAFRRSGGTLEQLLFAASEKISVNENRTWAAPDENGVARHTGGL